MKNQIKKSPYATLSAATVKAPKKPTDKVRAQRTEGGDLRVKGGASSGK